MNSQGPNEVSPEAMQARIQQARREAETLKDRIKRRKDELADTTRTSSESLSIDNSMTCQFSPLSATFYNSLRCVMARC